MEFAEGFGQFRGDFGELRGEIGALRGELAKSTLTIVYVNTFTTIGVGGLVLAATQLA